MSGIAATASLTGVEAQHAAPLLGNQSRFLDVFSCRLRGSSNKVVTKKDKPATIGEHKKTTETEARS